MTGGSCSALLVLELLRLVTSTPAVEACASGCTIRQELSPAVAVLLELLLLELILLELLLLELMHLVTSLLSYWTGWVSFGLGDWSQTGSGECQM